MKLFRDGTASDLRSALEYEGLESSFGEIEGCNQPVVSPTDDDDAPSLRHGLAAPFGMFQDFQRRQTSVRSHDAATWMRRRSAHPQVLDRRLVLCVSRYWAQEEQLLQGEFALENV